MWKILKLLIRIFGNDHFRSPAELKEGEPYLLIGASDPMAPATAERLAGLKLRVQGKYRDFERLNKLAGTMREWASKNIKKRNY